VNPIEKQYSNEVPDTQCFLLSTQIDFLKVLVCIKDIENGLKLTNDAQDRLEIEKQNRVKSYMDDII
jgi:uncharacterized protein YlaN (UPF0358 family)